MSWFTESNRWKHFVLGIPDGLLGTILFAAGTATGMEVKDCHYDKDNANKPIYKWSWKKWDWLDWDVLLLAVLLDRQYRLELYS